MGVAVAGNPGHIQGVIAPMREERLVGNGKFCSSWLSKLGILAPFFIALIYFLQLSAAEVQLSLQKC
jgi:hypothetical protein